jgi:sterol desaturase/sphingolipid hydroxylase (fatty acid hydroxylase superfamily)
MAPHAERPDVTLLQPLLIDIARLAAWLLLLALIFLPLERLFALHPQKILRPAIARDLGFYFLSGLLPGLLLTLPLTAAAWSAHLLIPAPVHTAILAWPLWLRASVGFVIAEFGFYWGHRWSHAVPLLWRFHSIHHAAERLDFLVNTRAHPVDLIFVRLCGLVPLYVLGLASPLSAGGSVLPLLIVLLATVWGFFIHANLRWRLGKLEWLIATPAFHHWHHTLADPRDRNFAAMLPWMDRLFGTLHLPRRQWPANYGIDAALPDSLGGQLLYPLQPPAEGTEPAAAER